MTRYYVRFEPKTATYQVVCRLTDKVLSHHYPNRTAAKHVANTLNAEMENDHAQR